jgi:cytochrome c oxidase cbb3-type subunit 3
MRLILMGCLATLWLSSAACNRRVASAGQTGSDSAHASKAVSSQGAGVRPGISPEAVLGPVRNPYTDDPKAIAAGRQLFTGFNCAGCHSGYAGGGMGPSLRDSLWNYGGEDTQIFSSIAEGRPNGMPAWAGRLPNDQIWRLVAYIKTLSTTREPVKPPTPSQGG